MSNVTNLDDIRANPRTVKENYHTFKIVVSYDPDAKQWHWTATRTYSVTLEGDASTVKRAQAAAKAAVDRVNGE